MSQRQDWVRLIRQYAAKYGVDPQAALAVASREGLGGGVGDQGTSFGPFQLHEGGALPRGRGRSWAESPAGIEYALRQIGGVAKGLHGRQAVSNIVSRFERPADPAGEIAGAAAALGQFGGAANAAVAPARPGPAPGLQASAPEANPAAAMLLQQLQAGGGINWMALAAANRRPAPKKAAPTRKPAAAGGVPMDGDPARGKIIGLPHQGTHTLGNWESDNAIDVSVPEGTPIRAPFSGTVGSQIGSLGKSGRFAGLRLHIASPNDEWYGAHLRKLLVHAGQKVKAGQIIGYSGSANGVAHLHEALRKGDPRRLDR